MVPSTVVDLYALHTARHEDLQEFLASAGTEERQRLLAVCNGFSEEAVSRDVKLRVCVVRALVMSLPVSLPKVREWLANPRLYDIHFTLFCYLYWVNVTDDPPVASWLKKEILLLVDTYLLSARRNSGMAAWMAGEMLGDDWPVAESLPVLIKVLHNARYVAGRRAALHSLEAILRKGYADVGQVPGILKALRHTARHDRSGIVRREAAQLSKQRR